MNTTTYLRRSLLQTALAATLGASLAGIAPLTMAQNAQNFPSKPITLIAP
jgi:tripartite-type tricarboxylate transporter receptor subunit TctC